MISMKELLGPHKLEDCTPEQVTNLTELLERINQLRTDYGKPLTVTSGLRTLEDMKRIYKSDVFPKKSNHLFGRAVDFADPSKALYNWLRENDSARMKQYNLWGELDTNGWVHVQIVPMSSYKKETDIRWFKA